MQLQKISFRHLVVALCLLIPSWGNAGRVDIYLIAGQSNADGCAVGTALPTAPVNLQIPQDDVPIFYRTTRSATTVYKTLRPGASGTVEAFGAAITQLLFNFAYDNAIRSIRALQLNSEITQRNNYPTTRILSL